MSVFRSLWPVAGLCLIVTGAAQTTPPRGSKPRVRTVTRTAASSVTAVRGSAGLTSQALLLKPHYDPTSTDVETGPTQEVVSSKAKKGGFPPDDPVPAPTDPDLMLSSGKDDLTLQAQDVTSRTLVMEMALFLYYSDHHAYPASLGELQDPTHDYIRSAASLRNVHANSSTLHPPVNYRWFYDCTTNGQIYLLGLTPKRQLSMSIDLSMPIACSLEDKHPSLIMPGKEVQAVTLRYRERRAKDPAH